jgi:hypothetical protein
LDEGDNLGQHEDGLEGTEMESSNSPSQMKPFSGLLASIANIEDNLIHMTRSATAKLDLFMVAPPKIISLEEDRMLSSDAMLTELRSLRQHLIAAYQTLGRALAQLNASNAHCTSIRLELDHVQEQLQNATKKKERGSKKIKARFLTSKNLRSEFEREDAERQEREQLTAEKNKQKEVLNAESARQVADDAVNRTFDGRIASYKKNDLRGLALSLCVSDKGDKKDIKARIEEKFASEPDLKKNVRYSGLFENPRARHRRPRVQTSQAATNAELDSDVEFEGGGDIEPINEENDDSESQVNQAVLAQPPLPPPSVNFSIPATQPVPPTSYHLQNPYPYTNHPPNYYPYYALNHPPFAQNGYPHPHQQYQFQSYNPSNSKH